MDVGIAQPQATDKLKQKFIAQSFLKRYQTCLWDPGGSKGREIQDLGHMSLVGP